MLTAALGPSRADALDNATDFTDLWWNQAESGWGLQITQTGDVLFATLYVYDAGNLPTFFVAALSRSGTTARGDLLRTSGPPYTAARFDPALVQGVRVGVMSFEAIDDVTASLDYLVNGARVQKTITRQQLRFDDFNGRFPAIVSRTSANCPAAGFDRTRTGAATLAFTQSGSAMSLEWVDGDGVTCTYRGVFDQRGKVGIFQATYTCTNAEEGNAAIAPLRIVDGTVSGRLRAHGVNDGCDHAASFATVVPR